MHGYKDGVRLEPSYYGHFESILDDLIDNNEAVMIPAGKTVFVLESEGWLRQDIKVKLPRLPKLY
jgi:hypothetical protein